MELTAISVYEKSLIMMSICIKINNVFGKKIVSKKILPLSLFDDVCR